MFAMDALLEAADAGEQIDAEIKPSTPLQEKPSLTKPASAAATIEEGGSGDGDEDDADGKDNGDGSDSDDDDEKYREGENDPIEDETVTEQRRLDKENHLREMQIIEEEYATLKEKLYTQRLYRVEDSLRRLKEGRLSRFKHQQEAIEKDRTTRFRIAAARKAFREKNHAAVRDSRKQGALSDVDEYARALKHQMIEKLTTEMKQAEQNKESMDEKFVPTVSSAPKLPFYRRGYITGGRKRSIGDDGTADRKRWRFNPVTSRVKPIIYELDEDEVDDDLFAMGAPGYGPIGESNYWEEYS